MSIFSAVREDCQRAAEAIAMVAKTEVEIVDADLVKLAGTGSGVSGVNQRLRRSFIARQVIKKGVPVFIIEAGSHEICRMCPLGRECYYRAATAYPIRAGSGVEGVIILTAYDSVQKEGMRRNQGALGEFLDRVAALLARGAAAVGALAEKERSPVHKCDGGGIIPLEEMEKDAITRALDSFGWSDAGKREAACALGISRATIYRKISRYRLAGGSGSGELGKKDGVDRKGQ